MSAGVAVRPERGALIGAALWWRDHVAADPEAALCEAGGWLARRGDDPELRVLARHIACLASVERGRLRQALRHARIGVAGAHRAELPQREAQLRLTLAWIELDRGAAEACREQLKMAEPHLAGVDSSRAACLRGLLHVQSDRYDEAVTELTGALRRLTRDGDRHWMANALLGRGLAHFYGNRLDEADSDLRAAERVFAEDGRSARAAACLHNQGCVAFRGGDLPKALRLFEAAEAAGLDAAACPEVLADRAEALAAAGLDGEAREALLAAARQLARHGRTARLAETRLALATSALRDGDELAAAGEAQQARRLFRTQRRPAWVALATATMWQARLRSGQRSRYALVAARRAAAKGASHGWAAAAAELRLTAGIVAHQAGMTLTSARLLGAAADVRHERTATAPLRAVGWLAEATLARYAGHRERVFEACRGGLRTIEDHAASMAGFELRVQAFGWAEQLGELAVGAALETGDPKLVLRWTERSRANALQLRVLRPPADPELRAALVELRDEVTRQGGRPGNGESGAEIAALEARVRHRAMLVDGSTRNSRARLGMAELAGELGDSVLLSLFTHRGGLHGVAVVDGCVRLAPLGGESEAVARVERLRHFLTRQAQGGSPRLAAVLAQEVRAVAEELESQLLGPVLAELRRGRPLVVVPTGELHALPWSALPSCRGRGVTVAPSLRCWLGGKADARATGASGQVWVSGPGLDHAEREVRTLHGEAGGRLLVGAEATAEDVLDAVDGACTAHIAAHGWFRDDQPLLSCLELADGPLYGHDLDRLHRGPTTVVLSACEVGRSVVSRGDQLSGLAAVLLGRGTATVIASVVPVPDERTAAVMLSLHTALRRGAPPAEALAVAQAVHGEAGFLCLGYGGR